MSFVTRQINLQFSGSQEGKVVLEGMRCQAVIFNPGGDNSIAQIQLKVYGMSLEHMNRYSSEGANLVQAQNYSVTVVVGDEGNPLLQVFSGHIYSSFIDFSSVPDVSFVVSAAAGYLEKVTPVAPNTYPGSQNAEDIIEALTNSMGKPWAFQNYNNNAHAIVTNQYLSGSVIQQIQTVAKAACLPIKIENNTVSIWSNGTNVDGVIVAISPQQGLVGYPAYIPAGFSIKTQFNASITNGRKINLTTAIIKANGLWDAHVITHELSSVTPDGPWFTNCILNRGGSDYVARN